RAVGRTARSLPAHRSGPAKCHLDARSIRSVRQRRLLGSALGGDLHPRLLIVAQHLESILEAGEKQVTLQCSSGVVDELSHWSTRLTCQSSEAISRGLTNSDRCAHGKSIPICRLISLRVAPLWLTTVIRRRICFWQLSTRPLFGHPQCDGLCTFCTCE